jgi:hypothetical protein
MSMLARILGSAALMVIATFGVPILAQAAVGEPTNLDIVGNSSTNDTTPKFTWSAASGATWYEYEIDNGDPIALSNVRSVTLSDDLDDGWHEFRVRAYDTNDNASDWVELVFEIDTVGPTVPAVNPTTAIEDEATTLTVSPTGEAWTTECDLHVGSSNKGAMTALSNGKFTKTYTFNNDGNYTVYAVCTDGDGNETTGVKRTVIVTDIGHSDGGAQPGDLIKMQCPEIVHVNDPCTTVYYWGEDGLRHVFPNERVFFSWYNDYDDVIIVGDEFMSDLRLGKNVTLKPGTAPVKFATSNEVYAVSEGGILHHYVDDEFLVDDYGSNWTKDLVIISDVFYSNYEIDSVINSDNDYDPDQAEDIVSSVDDNFYPG